MLLLAARETAHSFIMIRRSARLLATRSQAKDESSNKLRENLETTPSKKRRKKIPVDEPNETKHLDCLPRSRESALLKKNYKYIIGVDEAGRGPLAGPVVAAAAWVPTDIQGITDSKKLTDEAQREELYEKIICSPGVCWAVSVIDSKRIDEINILQATLEGMRVAASALTNKPLPFTSIDEANAEVEGSYVVKRHPEPLDPKSTYALIDGNRLPKDMSIEAETIVKGDSKEYCIAAASIIAKVTRDRLMNAYHEMYPDYNLIQHKGYPTKAHMAVIHQRGATPIHRYTFAPLKHMKFDPNGKVIQN